jgi:hypothetical protein
MNDLPKAMRGVWLTGHGGTDKLSVRIDIPSFENCIIVVLHTLYLAGTFTSSYREQIENRKS